MEKELIFKVCTPKLDYVFPLLLELLILERAWHLGLIILLLLTSSSDQTSSKPWQEESILVALVSMHTGAQNRLRTFKINVCHNAEGFGQDNEH
jgi:hypothetical protein